jgi:hypothetical protein
MNLRVALFGLALVACSHVSTVTPPEFPDGRNAANDTSRSVPQGGVDWTSHQQPKCDRDIRVVNDEQLAEGYQLVSETTVSCPPGEVLHGTMRSCDERLRERACAVGADVVIMKAHDQNAAEVTARLVRLPK